MRVMVILVIAAGFTVVLPAIAHPGGLNGEGCHNNRKTGDYHCHGGKATSARSSAAAKAVRLASGGSGGSAYYANCTAAREAGAAPVRAGDPGYSRKLDRDGDGVGCE